MLGLLDTIAQEEDDYEFAYNPFLFTDYAVRRAGLVSDYLRRINVDQFDWSDPMLKLLLELEAKDLLLTAFANGFCIHRRKLESAKAIGDHLKDLEALRRTWDELKLGSADNSDFSESLDQRTVKLGSVSKLVQIEKIGGHFYSKYMKGQKRYRLFLSGGTIKQVPFSTETTNAVPNYFACRMLVILRALSDRRGELKAATAATVHLRNLYVRFLLRRKGLSDDALAEKHDAIKTSLKRLSSASRVEQDTSRDVAKLLNTIELHAKYATCLSGNSESKAQIEAAEIIAGSKAYRALRRKFGQ